MHRVVEEFETEAEADGCKVRRDGAINKLDGDFVSFEVMEYVKK